MNWTEQDLQRVTAERGLPYISVGDAKLPKAGRSRARGIAPKEERTYLGRVYHSKTEAEWAMKLDLWTKASRVALVEPQVSLPIIVNGHKICRIVVDFGVTYTDGMYELIEVKGFETDIYKLKAKLLRACYPQHKYTVVKI